MPYSQPTTGDVHVNRPLTNISIAYMQDISMFVAPRVFPNIPVESKSDDYFTFPRGHFNRDEMKERRPGTESAGGRFEVSTDQYYTRVWAFHYDLADQIRANQDNPLNLDRMTTEFVTRKGLLQKEVAWKSRYMKTGVWTFEAAGAANRSSSFDPASSTDSNRNVVHWSDGSSTPIEDIRFLKRRVLQETGFMPNILTLSRHVYDTLLDHGDIVGRIDRGQTPGNPAIVTRQNLAALFELDEILVMDAIVNSAAEGLADKHDFIAEKDGLLSYRPPAPGILVPSAGYTFSWTGFVGAGPDGGVRIKRFRMEKLESDRIEGQFAYDFKVTGSDLGVFLKGIVE